MPFIEFALRRIWFNDEPELWWRKNRVTDYGIQVIKDQLDKPTIKKIKYVGRFAIDRPKIMAVPFHTTHDGDYDYYRNIVEVASDESTRH